MDNAVHLQPRKTGKVRNREYFRSNLKTGGTCPIPYKYRENTDCLTERERNGFIFAIIALMYSCLALGTLIFPDPDQLGDGSIAFDQCLHVQVGPVDARLAIDQKIIGHD
jgi:hypothetical protein